MGLRPRARFARASSSTIIGDKVWLFICRSGVCNFPRSWLLPVLKDNVKDTELKYFFDVMLPLSANLRTKGRFAILKLVYFACLGFFITTCSSTSKRFHVPRYLGAFLWDDQDQNQCSKITWMMLYQNNESMDPCPKGIHRLIWCNITRVISDHWSWHRSSHRNAPFAEYILEIGQWGSNRPPSVILGDPFSKNGVQERESPKRYSTWVGLAGRFAAILEHSWQMKKPGLELLQNPGCLYVEIRTQTKKRKAIETVSGYKRSK